MNYTDRINPISKGLTTYLEELRNMNYQIPTFQREIVWDEINVKKLWDSIYKFYPLGSILIWKTDVKLQNHRQIGGHQISDTNFNRTEYQYILDGQQRTTSLLTSLHGGSIEGRQGFDPLLYVDLTVEIENNTDDESYSERFLFWNEIERSSDRKKKFDEGLIVKLIDIKTNFTEVFNKIFNGQAANGNIAHPIIIGLQNTQSVLENYRISFIEIRGIQVSEVCQIFERINQAGKQLNIFDIVVAKTFRPATTTPSYDGFYLRDLIVNFREQHLKNSEFVTISDFEYLQILAVIIRQNVQDSGVRNITNKYLNEIKTEHILAVWEDTKKAIRKTVDFFENHLHIKTPHLIPLHYFYLTIAAYFFKNDSPDYPLLKKYFWFYCFHNKDLLSNSTDVWKHVALLNEEKRFDSFLIDKQELRSAKYSSQGRMSRAILALYASAQPKDWEHCDRDVLVQNIFFSTDKPNLHHIFPTNSEYVLKNKHKNKIGSDSLMNIAYLTQITNLNITNKNPLDYMRNYDKPEFERIMPSHLLSREILDWARSGVCPEDAIDQFIESRVNNILANLKIKLDGITFEVMDTADINGKQTEVSNTFEEDLEDKIHVSTSKISRNKANKIENYKVGVTHTLSSELAGEKWTSTEKKPKSKHHKQTEDDCKEEWEKEENKPIKEIAEYLEKLISESGAIEELTVRYKGSAVFFHPYKNIKYFSIKKEQDPFILSIYNEKISDEVKERLTEASIPFEPTPRGAHILIKDKEFVKQNQEMFIKIAEIVKELRQSSGECTHEDWTRVWLDKAKWAVEIANYLKELISGAKVFEEQDLTLNYTKAYIGLVVSSKEIFHLGGKPDGNIASLSFNAIKVKDRPRLKEILGDLYLENDKNVYIKIDKQLVEQHQGMFIEIAKFVKDVKIRA